MTSLELYGVMPGVERAGESSLPVVPRELDESRARRILNVAVAAIGLVIAAPLLLGIAILVRLTSPGPVLYRQVRVGLDSRNPLEPAGNHRRLINYGGRPFTIYKFRTMSSTGRTNDKQVWATKNDARVTPLGRILRKYRLDELPQLFNVLKGDMNIVGPRPEQPNLFASLSAQVPNYADRQRVRPGITGWAQINHHYDTSIEDVRKKVGFDLEYIARQSALEDLRIMLRTAPVLVFKKGAW
jgi:lipopolysaccharide/colanic/teichoic acid biosynthesis glycosyltransferase